MSDSVNDSIRTAQFRITCFHTTGETTTAAYAEDMAEAARKQDSVTEHLVWNGWNRSPMGNWLLTKSDAMVDVKIVSVATGKTVF